MYKIFFDLDGTLIDASQRQYKVFNDLLKTNSTLSYDAYWNLKRAKVDHSSILKNYYQFNDKKIADFKKQWLNTIEAPENLLLDTPFDKVHEVLEFFSGKYQMNIITARQSLKNTVEQLHQWKWVDFIDKIIATEQLYTKAQLIKNNYNCFSQNDILIGDTDEDINTAHALGIRSVAVLSGIRNAEILKSRQPDFIINNISELGNLNLA